LKARLSHSLRSACSVDLRARSLPMHVAAMASQASLAIRFLESENCISGGTAAMRASRARRSSWWSTSPSWTASHMCRTWSLILMTAAHLT
jgi:hypothetical protein